MSKLSDCFLSELAEIYDAENQLTRALPKMAAAAQNDELKAALNCHRAETEEHVLRLERVFELLGQQARNQKCKAMQSLIAASEKCIDDNLGDAALICAAQKIEHHEIASYGCLRSWAQFLDYAQAANLIEETLDEESGADEHLTSLAVQIINLEAWEPEYAF